MVECGSWGGWGSWFRPGIKEHCPEGKSKEQNQSQKQYSKQLGVGGACVRKSSNFNKKGGTEVKAKTKGKVQRVLSSAGLVLVGKSGQYGAFRRKDIHPWVPKIDR